jgi:hypothetical protein
MSDYRVAARLYPRDRVCFRYVSVNTLYKGDDNELQKTAILDTAHVLWKVLM